MNQGFKILETPKLQNPCLVVGWNPDVAGLGSKSLEFLIRNIKAREFARINPSGFFSLAGVLVEDNVIQFPQSKFYVCEEKDLMVFFSNGPSYSHYEFLTMLLDIAGQFGTVREMYTLGGIVSLSAHSNSRKLSSVVNQPELKQVMAADGLSTDLEYETPVGARPTLSSLLLWMAQKRNITAANLWADIPFYLAAIEDPRACKQVLSFLDQRLNLGLDYTTLDQEMERQDRLLAELKEKDGNVHRYITMLERGIMLSEKEGEELANKVAEFLQKKN